MELDTGAAVAHILGITDEGSGGVDHYHTTHRAAALRGHWNRPQPVRAKLAGSHLAGMGVHTVSRDPSNRIDEDSRGAQASVRRELGEVQGSKGQDPQ